MSDISSCTFLGFIFGWKLPQYDVGSINVCPRNEGLYEKSTLLTKLVFNTIHQNNK